MTTFRSLSIDRFVRRRGGDWRRLAATVGAPILTGAADFAGFDQESRAFGEFLQKRGEAVPGVRR